MLRVMLTSSVFILLLGCSTMRPPRAKCAEHLVPINLPAAEVRDGAPHVSADHVGERP